MPKQEMIEMTGVVETMSRDVFMVYVEQYDHVIQCHVSGKIRKNNIKIVEGDNVTIEVSPYDFSRGRIVYRN